jgi:hypothetical protein
LHSLAQPAKKKQSGGIKALSAVGSDVQTSAIKQAISPAGLAPKATARAKAIVAM